MSDVRCPSCGDSFRVPDFAVPAGAMAKCPWCRDSFSMSMLVVHLPPLAELIGEDGEPISTADLAQGFAAMSLATVGAASGATASTAPSFLDTDPAMLGAADLQDRDFDTDDFDGQRLANSEVANDVGEFAEEGVTFADAGVPEPTNETTEWNLDSPQQPVGDENQAYPNADVDDEFDIQGGSPPRPLAEVTDFGRGRDDRGFTPRPRTKRQGSPVKSILGIVIGGLMAFPLAAGILALAGKPLDLGFWPFDGQAISMNANSRRGAAPPMERSPRVANNTNNGNRGGRSLVDGLPSLDVDPPSLANSPGDTDSGFPDPPVSDDLDNLLAAPSPSSEFAEIKPPSSIELPPLDLPTTTPAAAEPEMEAEISDLPAAITAVVPVPAIEPAVEEIAATPEVPATSEEPKVADPTAPEPSQTLPTVSPKLQATLEAASVAMGDVVNYDDSEGIKGKRTRLAALFAKVAEVASSASSDDEAAVGSLVERLVDSDLVKDLAPAAPNWARFASRPNNGMLATGKLRLDNDQWLLDWTGPTPLEVRFADPSIAEAGADVIILGTIQQTDPSTVVEVKYLQKQ